MVVLHELGLDAELPPARRAVGLDQESALVAVNHTLYQKGSLEPCLDELEVYTAGEKPRNIALASTGTKARASGVYPNSELHRLEHINDGHYGNDRSWISNETGRGWVQLEFPEPAIIDRVVWGRDREQKFADRLASDYRVEVSADGEKWTAVAGSWDRRPPRRS